MNFLDFYHEFYTILLILYRKMTLTQAQITRLTALTALLPAEHVSIDSVLDSFDAIANIASDDREIFQRSGASFLDLATDVVSEDPEIADSLLLCSPQKVVAHQIVLAGIMHGE